MVVGDDKEINTMVGGSVLSGKGKLLLALTGAFVPLSGAYAVLNVSSIKTQGQEYLNLASGSESHLKSVEKELAERSSFITPPKHDLSKFYEELVEMHQNRRRCSIKVHIIGWDNWKDLGEVKSEHDKAIIANGVSSLGVWRIKEACKNNRMGATIWLKQRTSWRNANWKYWVIQTSMVGLDKKYRYSWAYQR